jgi:iron complex outermembrane receptor protein
MRGTRKFLETLKKCMNNRLILALLCLCTHQIYASLADSMVHISSIHITTKKTEKILFTNHLFSANRIQNSSSNFYVKNYGMGQISSFSFRGNTPENTQILWNEIPINSPMNQLLDLNLLQNSQGSKSYFTLENNQFGNAGSIWIEPQQIKETTFSLSSTLFSYNLFSNDFLYHQKFKKSTLSMNHQMIHGKNNYKYIDAFNERKKLSNNAISQYSSTLDYTLSLSKWQFQTGLWHIYAFKEIPPTRTTNSSLQSLEDHNLRAFASLSNSMFTFKTSIHSENQNYIDLDNAIKATHRVLSLKNVLKIQEIRIKKMSISFSQNQNVHFLNSSNYNNTLSQLELNNFLSFSILNQSKNQWEFGIKQITQSHNVSAPLPFLKYNYLLSKNIRFETQASINQRMPSLNELFWNPGGNLFLQPETNYNFNQKIQYQNSRITADVSVFYNHIQDGIRWLPSANASIWSPQNINIINNMGLNFDFDGILIHKKALQIQFIQSFLYLRSIWNHEFEQIYTPRFKSISHVNCSYKKWKFSAHANYTSARYTLTDNTQLLPQYITLSSQLVYTFHHKKWMLQASANIDNITNISYQEIENRALPLRTFFIQLKINYKPNKN